MSLQSEVRPIAYLRDVGDDEDPCFVACAKGDAGSFGVYTQYQFSAATRALVEALQIARTALNSVHETDGLLDHEQPALGVIDAALKAASS